MAGAEIAELLRIGRRLCGNAGERFQHRPRQRRNAAVTGGGAIGHARVYQKQRDTPSRAFGDEVWPKLRFHQHARARREAAQERTDRKRDVVRKPGLHDPRAEERASRFASRCRHVRQEQRKIGTIAQHAFHQRHHGARLTQRHRMDPQNAARAAPLKLLKRATAFVKPTRKKLAS